MSSEYLTRRGFNKRVILSGALGLIGSADLVNTGAKLGRLKKESQKEVIEQGITPPDQVKEIRQLEEVKSQQVIFDKAVQESFVKKTNGAFDAVRIGTDFAGILVGSALGFYAMYRKRPS